MNEENLETEYKTLVDKITKEIDVKTEKALGLLKEAIALSDQHGVPFTTSVSLNNDKYIPESFLKIRKQFLDKFDPGIELNDLYDYDNYYYGKPQEENDLKKDFDETNACESLRKILGFLPWHQPVAEWDYGAFQGWQTECWSNSSAYC